MDRKVILKTLYFAAYSVILVFWLQSSFLLFRDPDLASVLLGVARLCGLSAVFCVLTQLMLIGRIKWVERVWGHDKLAIIHHTTGRLVLYFILIHFTLILSSYALSSHVNLFTQFLTFINTYDDVLNAFIAFVLFVTIALSSIYISKLKLKYETWYYVHLMVYVAILLAFSHQLRYGGTLSQPIFALYWQGLYVFVLGNFLVFRFCRPLYFFYKHRFYVSSVVSAPGEITKITISGRDMEHFSRIAGQFMIFRFLDKKRIYQAHPFSLSWGTNHVDIRVCAKDSGDFTHELSGLKVGTPVLIDGPHGKFTIEDENINKFLFIAGGIGITPIRSLLEEHSDRDIVFFYSNKVHTSVPLLNELQKLTTSKSIPSYYFYSEENIVPKGSIKGRITKEILQEKVKDIKKREIYVCGPEAFMQAMTENLLQLGVNKSRIHSERFSFH